MAHPVSGYLLVQNERRSIEASVRCLLNYCDDVLIVDGGSKDGTTEKLLGMQREFDNLRLMFWNQKGHRYDPEWKEPDRRNWAAQSCTHDWVLTIDGDELLEDLPTNYFREIDTPLYFDRYNLLNRKETILRYHAPHGWEEWFPDHQVRYFNRSRSHYTNQPLHCYLVDDKNSPVRHQSRHCDGAIIHYHALVNPDRKWDNAEKRKLMETGTLNRQLPFLDRMILAQPQ